MSFADADLTRDAFLGGRVTLLQPRKGYRAATDPVLLAAAVPAKPGQSVLDLGCGAGAAMFCLAARVPDLVLTGLELQPDYAGLARRNADLNGLAAQILTGSVDAPPADLKTKDFDHVLTNPPYFAASQTSPATDSGRDRAHRSQDGNISAFLDLALRRLRPGGTLTLIHRVEALPELLVALDARVGDIRILPIAPRTGRPAKRLILQARKGTAAPFQLLAPLIVHAGDTHQDDRPDYTDTVTGILRNGAPLPL